MCDPLPFCAVLPNCGCHHNFHLAPDKKQLDVGTCRLKSLFTEGTCRKINVFTNNSFTASIQPVSCLLAGDSFSSVQGSQRGVISQWCVHRCIYMSCTVIKGRDGRFFLRETNLAQNYAPLQKIVLIMSSQI